MTLLIEKSSQVKNEFIKELNDNELINRSS